jgi:hypothetical protein
MKPSAIMIMHKSKVTHLFEENPNPSILFPIDVNFSVFCAHCFAFKTHAGSIPFGHEPGVNDNP